MIAVVARLGVQPGKEAEFEQVMSDLAVQVREKEPGCALYALCKGREEGSYVVLERYVDQAALAAHSKTDYFRDAFAKLGACLAGAPQIDVLNELG